jgi:hypothetical protein
MPIAHDIGAKRISQKWMGKAHLRVLEVPLYRNEDCGRPTKNECSGPAYNRCQAAELNALTSRPAARKTTMEDMKAHLEKLRIDAEDCTLISKLATDMQKRELFARLAEHLGVLASEVERALAAKMAGGDT